MSDGERFEMPIVFRDDPPEEPEVDESPKVHPFVTIACVALMLAVSLRFLPYQETATDGSGTVTTTSWKSVGHWLKGADATSRTETARDGDVEYGPIKDGKRHGTWTHRKGSGDVIFSNFRLGKPR